jgi:hypothetical protein
MSTTPKNPKTEIDGDGDGDGEPGKASGFATSKWRRHQVAKPVASIEKHGRPPAQENDRDKKQL